MWQQYTTFVQAISEKLLNGSLHYEHLLPEDNFVWMVSSDESKIIVKIGPKYPYRLVREIKAYQHLTNASFEVPRLIDFGEFEGIPYIALEYCGENALEAIFKNSPDLSAYHIFEKTLEILLRFSQFSSNEFHFIKRSITTKDRDLERLAATTENKALGENHKQLLVRISKYLARPYSALAHRDFSPRQIVVSENKPMIIDFESIGPGQVERDIGDFLGGIIKFGKYHPRYLEIVRNFTNSNSLNFDQIIDFAAYSPLWAINSGCSDSVIKIRLQSSTMIIQNNMGLTWDSGSK